MIKKAVNRIQSILKKLINRETILYLFFGVMTTVVNYGVFWLFLRILGKDQSLISNTIAFVFAVAFAYITNKLFVFEEHSWKASVLKKEIVAFLSTRIFTFLFEQAGLFVFGSLLHFENRSIVGINGIFLVKAVLSVVVVVANYFFSKKLIFIGSKNSE